MSFEEKIRQSVGRALDDVRTRVEHEVRALVQELAASAAEERQLAVSHAREQTLLEARCAADQRVADAEAHLTATIDRVVADACAREREQASRNARLAFDSEADARGARVLEAIRALDAAASVSGVLDALAAAVDREAGRTAVFVVRGQSIQGWALSGFGALDANPTRFDVPIAQARLVQLAIQTGRAALSSDAAPSPVALDAALTIDGAGIAIPLLAGDRIVAVIYADALSPDGREAVVPRGWITTIELLARHGARCVAALQPRDDAAVQAAGALASGAARPRSRGPEPASPRAATTTTGGVDASEASARRLARLLIEEIKLHNAPSVEEGRATGNLLVRLAPQIERARRVYDARVPVALPSRARLFHHELVTTLADGDASRLGVSA